MKRVLFVVHSLGIGGVEKILIEILNSLNRDNFDIKLVVNSQKENLLEKELNSGIKIDYIYTNEILQKLEKLEKRKIIKYFYKKYIKYKIRKKYNQWVMDRDVIVDFSNGKNITKLRKKIKKICWIHGNIYNVFNFKKRKKIYKTLQQFDKIICVSKEIKEDLSREFLELKERIEFLYNLLDIEKIILKSDEKNDMTLKDKRLLEKDYLLMISRLDKQSKDFETLINAYEIYIKRIKNPINLYIIGDGDYKEELRKLIEKKKLEENVLLLGKKLNPYPWIKNTKILIQSSKTEGLPTTLIEGLILKKLMIATECKTGPKEILENGELGVLVPIGNSEILSEKIIELLKENSELRLKIENNFKSDDYLNKYNKKEVIKKIEKLLYNSDV